eukprot:142952_1
METTAAAANDSNYYMDGSSPPFSNPARRTRVAVTPGGTPVGVGAVGVGASAVDPTAAISLRSQKAEKSEIFKFLRSNTAKNNLGGNNNNDKLNPALQRRLRD